MMMLLLSPHHATKKLTHVDPKIIITFVHLAYSVHVAYLRRARDLTIHNSVDRGADCELLLQSYVLLIGPQWPTQYGPIQYGQQFKSNCHLHQHKLCGCPRTAVNVTVIRYAYWHIGRYTVYS